MRDLGQDDSGIQPCILGMFLTHGFQPIVKHEAKFIVIQTYGDHEVHKWVGSYAYSIVRGFLHL
jgi:hypothetical protein